MYESGFSRQLYGMVPMQAAQVAMIKVVMNHHHVFSHEAR